MHIHFRAVHGHMEIVGTLVTEFLTELALQHFHILCRIALCVYSSTICTMCKRCFSGYPAPEYLVLDVGNHLNATKPSCKTMYFWRRVWYLMYNMEKPILYRMPKPNAGRWILKVFDLCAMNPCLNTKMIQLSSL